MKYLSDWTKIFLCFPALLLWGTQANAQQAHADVELIVAYPQDNQVIPFGDSVRLSFFIINHGPEDIVGDTLMIRSVNPMFGGGFIGDIPVGDTGLALGVFQEVGEGHTQNDTFDMCYYFRSPVSFSDRVVDTNAANDTACVSYVLLGDTTTGIVTSDIHASLKLFPNPASSWVAIQLEDAAQYHQLKLSVTDVLGREVFFHDFAAQARGDKNAIHFDVTGFSSGVYLVRLMADDKTFTNKLEVR